ncbi:MAG: radical SAM protein [Candidatus Omnitrophota bacterium]
MIKDFQLVSRTIFRGNTGETKPYRCHRGYYRLEISPAEQGAAQLSTCFSNVFIPGNRVVVKKGVREAWNAKQFRFQRTMISRGSWDFCRGANCCRDPFFPFTAHDPVKHALKNKVVQLDYAPPMLVVVPSFTCNNNCSFCYQSGMRRRRQCAQLSEELMKEIKEDLVPAARDIIVSGGEPLFAPVTREFIEWVIAHYPEKRLHILTNGILLDTFGRISSGIGVTVSLYGMSRQTYRAVTGADNFERVMRNITMLLGPKDKITELIFIVCRETAAETGAFCRFVEKHENIRAIVRNNCFEGGKYWKLMRAAELAFSGIASRIYFDYQDEAVFQRVMRKACNPRSWFCGARADC